jgi:hypothetical protein
MVVCRDCGRHGAIAHGEGVTQYGRHAGRVGPADSDSEGGQLHRTFCPPYCLPDGPERAQVVCPTCDPSAV